MLFRLGFNLRESGILGNPEGKLWLRSERLILQQTLNYQKS